MNSKKRIFYDLSEPISEDDPPKIKRLKMSFRTEKEADTMLVGCLLLFAIILFLSAVCR